MTRQEALKIAHDYVKALATDARNGATFKEKVAAVKGFARFLLEERPTEDLRAVFSGAGRVVDVDGIKADPVGTRYRDTDGDIWTLGPAGRLHIRPNSPGDTPEQIVAEYAPLTRLPRVDDVS